MQIASSREWWSVNNVAQKFFSYFEENQHVRLSSNPLIPVGDPNVPLIHNCLKRFKVAIDGSWRHRICYSLRCVTAASDEDVTSFRSDSTYHRLTEILGSWSFGDDIKEKAIGCSFSLLCKIYKLPQSRIYATYCSGDMSSRLSPDNESKKILQKYLEEERILPSMSKADFWMNGECGPCGPCIGFFCNSSDSQEGAGSEICRLVFVEYNRQADGVLVPLETKYVLTGVNLECLAAILQDKKSHYELDNYAALLADIYYHAGPGIENYSGKIGAADTGGVDTAYRLLADHTRVIAVANSPHSQLGIGNKGREYFLKCADIQVMQYGHKVLKIEIDDYDE